MKTFTVKQAQALVPSLSSEIECLRPVYSELLERWECVAQTHKVEVDDPAVAELCSGDERICELIKQIEKSLLRFRELGVECKGIEEGLFDFPCLLEDRVAYLCWQVDEPSVTHWHEFDTGFYTRRPLFEATGVSRNQELLN
jgi:hypothetical protein